MSLYRLYLTLLGGLFVSCTLFAASWWRSQWLPQPAAIILTIATVILIILLLSLSLDGIYILGIALFLYPVVSGMIALILLGLDAVGLASWGLEAGGGLGILAVITGLYLWHSLVSGDEAT